MSRFKKTREESEAVVQLIAQAIESQWGKKILPEGDGLAEKLQREAMVKAVWRDMSPAWAWKDALEAVVVEGTACGRPPKFGDVKAKVEGFVDDSKYPKRMKLLKWHKDWASEQLGYRV